ncbi:MAG: 2Fe-2S iron-sulfur cluster-binding protein [Opitutaceae bacterium]
MYLQILSSLVLVCALIWLLQQLRDSCKRKQAAAEFRQAELALLENTLLAEREKRERASHSAEAWSGFRKFKVARKQQEGGGICSFYLEAHDRKPIADFKPGQYLTFQLNIPDQAKPVVRCYSLSDCYRESNYRVSIKAALPPRNVPDAPAGLASNFFHNAIEEGQIVDVRAPSGHFFFSSESRRPVVLIGGGVGLTPVLSMLNHLSQEPGDREIWFFYGVRNGEEHILRDEMEAAAARSSNVHLVFCYSNPSEEDIIGGNVVTGRISIDLFKEKLGTNNYDFYICGPGPLMESMINGLRDWGVPDGNVYFETFGPSSVKKTRPSIPVASADAADLLTVEFRKSGKTVKWDGSCENLLELAESEDVSIGSGCRAGSCGSCQIAVISGKVKYPQSPDHDPEVGTCLTCVGQPAENLVIDA